MSKHKLITEIESQQMAQKTIPDFAPSDTVTVRLKIVEGTRQRVQIFTGVVIAIRRRGLGSGFTVRKISHGVGVERTFSTYSPLIESIEINRRGKVRQAKLYYQRELRGRAAKIEEKINKKKPTATPTE